MGFYSAWLFSIQDLGCLYSRFQEGGTRQQDEVCSFSSFSGFEARGKSCSNMLAFAEVFAGVQRITALVNNSRKQNYLARGPSRKNPQGSHGHGMVCLVGSHKSAVGPL